jgi:hypothetical protein
MAPVKVALSYLKTFRGSKKTCMNNGNGIFHGKSRILFCITVFSPVLGEAATVAASQGDMLAFVKVRWCCQNM